MYSIEYSILYSIVYSIVYINMCIPPGTGTRRRREKAVGLGYLGLPAARPAMSDRK